MTDCSYQLYSSRNHGPLTQTLPMLAELGYGAVEGFGEMLNDPAALRDLLDRNGLRMRSAHIALNTLETDPAAVIDMAQVLEAESLFVPFLPPDQRPIDAAGWQSFGQRLSAATAPVQAAGITLGWHNHEYEFIPLPDGSRPIDHILAADPALLWEADIAWIHRAGADPLAEIARYGDRIAAVHVKDVAPEGQNLGEDGWADPGHGVLDWGGLLAALRIHSSTDLYVMEHDNPSDDRRFATRAYTSFSEVQS